jgi:hypothetical protein
MRLFLDASELPRSVSIKDDHRHQGLQHNCTYSPYLVKSTNLNFATHSTLRGLDDHHDAEETSDSKSAVDYSPKHTFKRLAQSDLQATLMPPTVTSSQQTSQQAHASKEGGERLDSKGRND